MGGTSLVVQQLELLISTAGGTDSQIPAMGSVGQKKKKKNQMGEVQLGLLLSVAPHLTMYGPLNDAFLSQKFQSLQFLGLCLSIHE